MAEQEKMKQGYLWKDDEEYMALQAKTKQLIRFIVKSLSMMKNIISRTEDLKNKQKNDQFNNYFDCLNLCWICIEPEFDTTD